MPLPGTDWRWEESPRKPTFKQGNSGHKRFPDQKKRSNKETLDTKVSLTFRSTTQINQPIQHWIDMIYFSRDLPTSSSMALVSSFRKRSMHKSILQVKYPSTSDVSIQTTCTTAPLLRCKSQGPASQEKVIWALDKPSSSENLGYSPWVHSLCSWWLSKSSKNSRLSREGRAIEATGNCGPVTER